MTALTAKDFWAGLMFVGFGAAALIVGADLRPGTAADMGPGYVPRAIGWILVGLGGIISLLGALRPAEQIERLHARPLLLTVIAIVAFAIVLPRFGLVPALLPLIACAALAGRELGVLATLAIFIVMAVFCIVVFKIGLGMSLPIIVGAW